MYLSYVPSRSVQEKLKETITRPQLKEHFKDIAIMLYCTHFLLSGFSACHWNLRPSCSENVLLVYSTVIWHHFRCSNERFSLLNRGIRVEGGLMMGLESLSKRNSSERQVPTSSCLSVHTSSPRLLFLSVTKRRLCFTMCRWVEVITLGILGRFRA